MPPIATRKKPLLNSARLSSELSGSNCKRVSFSVTSIAQLALHEARERKD